jgi:hypothetical protein
MQSVWTEQSFPQFAGLKVKAAFIGYEFPLGPPLNTQVPHSSVFLHPVHPAQSSIIRLKTAAIVLLLFILLFSIVVVIMEIKGNNYCPINSGVLTHVV